jgi:hypothetical protein
MGAKLTVASIESAACAADGPDGKALSVLVVDIVDLTILGKGEDRFFDQQINFIDGVNLLAYL